VVENHGELQGGILCAGRREPDSAPGLHAREKPRGKTPARARLQVQSTQLDNGRLNG